MAAVPAESELAPALSALACRLMPGATGINGLRQLSGGAVQDTWAFNVIDGSENKVLVLRRARGALRSRRKYGVSLTDEARAIRQAASAGVPAPPVRYVLEPADALGEGFVMDFVEGETIPRRILRDAAYAGLRHRLATECGRVLAHIHVLDTRAFGFLEVRTPAETVARFRALYRELDQPSPIMELVFQHLAKTLPTAPERLAVVHGDFRIGNLLVGPEGLRAVLDWENVHLGDPAEDLGYIAVGSWRFGEIDRPVGGFGSRRDLMTGYREANGQSIDPARIRFWELALTLGWGLTCAEFARQFTEGTDPSIERGAIGRRRSEVEFDLLRLLGGAD